MAQEQGYITLGEAADKACFALEDHEGKLKVRMLDFGYDYIDKLKLVNTNEVKTVLLEMNDIKFIPFPKDFVKFTKIGTIEGGKVRLFTVNNRIALTSKFACGNYAPNPPIKSDYVDSLYEFGFPFFNYRNQAGLIQPIFGYGAGIDNNRDVRIDYANRGIQFSPTVHSTQIYLEYISTGFTPNEHTFLPYIAQRACRNYMIKQHYLFKGDRANAAMIGDEYYKEQSIVVKAFRGLSVQDIVHYTLRGFKQSVKTSL